MNPGMPPGAKATLPWRGTHRSWGRSRRLLLVHLRAVHSLVVALRVGKEPHLERGIWQYSYTR